MGGIAIVVPYADYTSNYIDKVSFLDVIDLESIDISFNGNSYIGEEFNINCLYYPSNASRLQCHMKYSIINGNSYATINENTGLVTILSNANNSLVTIKAESTYDNSIYNTKNINITYRGHAEYLYDITYLGYIGIDDNLWQFTPTFDPIDTIQTNVQYSIISGGEYAYIGSSNGILEVLSTAENESNIIVRCTSNYNQSIYRDLSLIVKYVEANYHKYYEELAYISSTQTGGQYIDLGCTLLENTDNIQIDIKFNLKDVGKNVGGSDPALATLISSQPEISPYPGFVLRRYNQAKQEIDLQAKWSFTNSVKQGKVNKWDSKYLSYYTSEAGTITGAIMGNIYEFSETLDNIPDSQINNITCTLFCALNSSNNPFRFALADLYYLKFTKGGQVIRDLIPAKRKSDNAIGLYDKENDHLYVSQGEEPFSGGSKI